MSSIAYAAVTIQTSPQALPSTPPWFGEVVTIAHYLTQQGTLSAIEQWVRFARRRFGHYDVIDFVAMLVGYALRALTEIKGPTPVVEWYSSNRHERALS